MDADETDSIMSLSACREPRCLMCVKVEFAFGISPSKTSKVFYYAEMNGLTCAISA